MKKFFRFQWVTALIALANVSVPASRTLADAIVTTKAMTATTIAEVFIDSDKVRLELEIGPDDISAFRNLLPTEIYDRFKFNDTTPADQRLRTFFADDLVLYADEKKLSGKVLSLEARKRIVRDEITGEPLPKQPGDGDFVVYAVVEYALAERPTTFSIQPPQGAGAGRVNATVGFITYHRGLPVMEFRYLSKKETLDLDWKDPWYSKFQNSNLHRQYKAPLSVFLYVENFEVRVEVVGRPADFQRFVELDLRGQVIPIAQQPEVNKRVAQFLREQFELSIDEERVDPTLDRIHFLDRTLKTTGVVFPDRDLDMSAALLGAIYVAPIQELPKNVKVRWKLFDERFDQIPSVATDEAGGLPSSLSQDDPVLEWKNFLTNPTVPGMMSVPQPPQPAKLSVPWLSLICLFLGSMWLSRLGGQTSVAPENSETPAEDGKETVHQRNWPKVLVVGLLFATAFGCWKWLTVEFAHPLAAKPTVTNEQADSITSSLMNNVYRSFDRRDESLVYDQLATSVSGDLLQDLFLQMMQRIKLESQGGARVKIKQLDLIDSQFTKGEVAPGFDARIRWNVLGQVGHWGHMHTRGNQYVADFSIQPDDGVWKISSMQIVDEEILGVVRQ